MAAGEAEGMTKGTCPYFFDVLWREPSVLIDYAAHEAPVESASSMATPGNLDSFM